MISTTARALALTLALATTLPAQVPQLLNYQGRVAVGTTNFDGAGQFKFALVNADGSTTYWSNDGTSSNGSEPTSAVTLAVTKGLYSVLLGDTTLSNMMAIPPGVFSNPDVRLRIWFDDAVNGSQLLTPDQRIAAAGYALMAGGLNLPPTSGADAGVILQNGNPLLHTFGSRNYFSGFSVGNFTLTGADNAAVGYNALTLNTTGNKNAGIGSGVLASNTTGLLNTASGYEALNANVIGNQNTATGAYALHNTVSNNNTASGYQALLSDSSGSGNTAFGWQSLKNNTTGSNNIALGKGAGADLTTGSNNIDIGNSGVAGESNIIRIGSTQTDTYLTGVIHGDGSGLTGITATGLAAASVTSTQLAADLTLGGTTTVSGILSLPPSTGVNAGVILQNGNPLLHTFGTRNFFAGGAGNFTTTGADNTVVGLNALSLNTSGSRNVAFGNSALAANTDGTNNTAVGFEALKANTTGDQNTAFGTYSLIHSNASYSTAFGYLSLLDNTTGSGNTAIGWLALSNNTTGGDNIALGKRAGQDLTTGSNNIVIGHRGIAGESNTIRIGDGVTQTDTYLTGVVHGDGSGLTNIPSTSISAPPPGMVLIPAGTFVMGNSVAADTDITDAEPVATTVSTFYMDATEVTLSQWQSVYLWALDQGYSFANAGAGKAANHPVHSVNWYDCVKWCNARSEQMGKTPVYYTDAGLTTVYRSGEVEIFANWAAAGYRLPTEAEWEKAARGGLSGQRFPWGAQISQNLANYTGNTASFAYDLGPDGLNPIGSVGGTSPATTPVGTFAANGYGLYDMAGNVFEWCWDRKETPLPGGTDPHGAETGTDRVFRGGRSAGLALVCRVAGRYRQAPDIANLSNGFRAVLAPGL